MTTKRYSQKIVTLGGGTGHFALLRGLVDANQPDLITAITGTWDSGGSSGRLRAEMGVLPAGDTRQCLLALMEDSSQRQVAQRLFNERFTDIKGPLRGHALGNLIQSQLQVLYQGQDRGLEAARSLFRVRGHILPVSLTDLELNAKTVNGNIIEGEDLIDTRGQKRGYRSEDKISRIYFDSSADPNPQVLEAISQADKIIFSPGDLYTSILPHLLVNGISQAIISSKAKIIFVLNLMTKKGETDEYKASDFIKSFLIYFADAARLNYLITNKNNILREVVKLYQKEGQKQVKIDQKECQILVPKAKIIFAPLAVYFPKEHLLRHDSAKLAEVILGL